MTSILTINIFASLKHISTTYRSSLSAAKARDMNPLLKSLLELVLRDLRGIRLATAAATHVVTATAQTPTTCYKYTRD